MTIKFPSLLFSIVFSLFFIACDSKNEPADSKNGVEIEFVSIPAGTFTMGSSSYETDRESDEGPQHSVSLPDLVQRFHNSNAVLLIGAS